MKETMSESLKHVENEKQLWQLVYEGAMKHIRVYLIAGLIKVALINFEE